MRQKKNQANHLSGILFLLVFFFSFQLFSSKLAPEQKADDAPETISVTALLQTDALQPQPLAKLKLTLVLAPAPGFFPAVTARIQEPSSFPITSSDEGPDPFCSFFYFHHSAYSDEPPFAA
jgi:hypothetical protein